ncbi:hypothetical protein GQ43DRAFT_430846 [Delitschia confertaspora ATCC 74209]|uniref:Uncharacterized protein n=1 Tax=Delitschia confertaspora ATCC 74209 TaxID=1513339 RepID=A0A9P4JTK8_9PLEO|nr:hypothetical protein GQ43DRAFT_430846 [Delitschia confertaspora ATCC 74209]
MTYFSIFHFLDAVETVDWDFEPANGPIGCSICYESLFNPFKTGTAIIVDNVENAGQDKTVDNDQYYLDYLGISDEDGPDNSDKVPRPCPLLLLPPIFLANSFPSASPSQPTSASRTKYLLTTLDDLLGMLTELRYTETFKTFTFITGVQRRQAEYDPSARPFFSDIRRSISASHPTGLDATFRIQYANAFEQIERSVKEGIG